MWHKSVRQGPHSDSWLVFEDEPGPDRLAEIEFLLQQGGQLGLRLRRCDCKPQLGAYAFLSLSPSLSPLSVSLSRRAARVSSPLLHSRCTCVRFFAGRVDSLAPAATSAWTGKRVVDRTTSYSLPACLGTSSARRHDDCSTRTSWRVMQPRQRGRRPTEPRRVGRMAQRTSNRSWTPSQQQPGGPISERS